MDFINRKYSLHPETEHIEILQGKEKVIWELEDKMFEDLDTNINDYIKKNPLRVGRKELDIIDGFRNGIKGLFVMTEYERDYTAFQNADGIYMPRDLFRILMRSLTTCGFLFRSLQHFILSRVRLSITD